MSAYIIGIDLGTTHSALAYTSGGAIERLSIPQLDAALGLIESPLLSSFLYSPHEGEALPATLPWESDIKWVVGALAKERGAEAPLRQISSSKSWLSCLGLDRRAPLLPEGDAEIEKISPLDAAVIILAHLKAAWNHGMPDAPFNEQAVLVTVPASFDPSARELVLEAAREAGYPEVTLLEEPLAAFYAWLKRNDSSWRKQIGIGSKVLVVDIGGGTTDFSLISVGEEDGELQLSRDAVGSHLLLGGDNLDWMMAHLARSKIEPELDDWQMRVLVHKCRAAKEALFSEKPPKQVAITIPGRSSKLIGGSLKCTLSLEEVEQGILEGFFPLVEKDAGAAKSVRSGLQTEGLPYAEDPRVTAQLAQFLGEKSPTHVLFNGGTTKSCAFRTRILQQLNQWSEEVVELTDAEYDFAVACGAAHYGALRKEGGLRVKAGAAHSYFIGVQKAAPAIPGVAPAMEGLLVVPFGMEEGSEYVLEKREFSLILGEPVSFRFFRHGSDASVRLQDLEELNPIETVLEMRPGLGKVVTVKLHSRLTELGVLELFFVTREGETFKLQFDVREEALASA